MIQSKSLQKVCVLVKAQFESATFLAHMVNSYLYADYLSITRRCLVHMVDFSSFCCVKISPQELKLNSR